MKSSLKLILFVIVVILLFFSGCVLVPVLDSVKNSGITEYQRKALLEKEIKNLQNARFWGERPDLMIYFNPENLDALQREPLMVPEGQRMVSSKIIMTTYEKEAFKAQAEVKINFYDTNSLIVSSREELQNWDFISGTGWKLSALKLKS
jgi:hypothetical protein